MQLFIIENLKIILKLVLFEIKITLVYNLLVK